MTKLPTPSVPELALATGSSIDEIASYFRSYYEKKIPPFNYVSSTKIIKSAYRGLHNESQLLAGCLGEKTKQGLKSNQDVVRLAAPLAFGRATHVVDLSRKQFQFGRELRSGYRIPFFFVENGKIILYFLQPRKRVNFSVDQLSMIATIHKRYLLDSEFYGQSTDIEYIDVSATGDDDERTVKCYRLSDLELWPEKRLADRLTMIAKALEALNESGVLAQLRRRQRPPVPELPLFD